MATIIETLNALRQPIPRAMLKKKSKGGKDIVFVPWHRAVELFEERAPGWSFEITKVVEAAGKVCMIVRVTVQCSDGVIIRDASGNTDDDLDGYGDPFSNSESMALRRAFAKFGFALYIYDLDRRGYLQANGYPPLGTGEAAAHIAESPEDIGPVADVDQKTGEVVDQPMVHQSQSVAETAQQVISEATGGMGQSDNADEPPPPAKPKSGRAAWEPESWKAEAEAAVAAHNLGAITNSSGLLAMAKNIGPDDPSKPEPNQTFARRNNVIVMLHEAACSVVNQAEGWTSEQYGRARDVILSLPTSTSGRKEALALCTKQMKAPKAEAPVQNGGVGEYPADWPTDAPEHAAATA